MARIKIIDDDRESAENMALLLRKEGHAVTYRDTTEGAIEEILADKPELLILDVMFPDNPSAGFELARAIRQRREIRTLPVILLTAVNEHYPVGLTAKDIDPAWMPVQCFMEKPVQLRALLTKISELLKPARRKKSADDE